MLNDFYDYLLNDKSEETAKGYIYDITTFNAFISERYGYDKNTTEALINAGTPDIYAFIDYELNTNKKSVSTVNRKLSSLKAYYSYLNEKHISDTNPIRTVAALKADTEQDDFFTLDECKNLLDAIRGRNIHRDKAIIFMFLTCGMTVNEIVSLKLSDIDEENIYIRKNGVICRIIEKTDALKSILSDYLLKERTGTSDILFLSNPLKGLSKRTLHQIAEKHLKACGIYKPGVTTENLRRSGVFLMTEHNTKISPKDIDDYLGLKRNNNTNIYFADYAHESGSVLIRKELLENNPLVKIYR